MPALERLATLSQQTSAASAPAQQLCVACSGASGAALPDAPMQPELTASAASLARMLAVIEDEIVPKTRVCVAEVPLLSPFSQNYTGGLWTNNRSNVGAGQQSLRRCGA